jgi:hypothetical protein
VVVRRYLDAEPLLRDEDCAVADVRALRLQPLSGLSARTRLRLQQTLLEWLRAQGNLCDQR